MMYEIMEGCTSYVSVSLISYCLFLLQICAPYLKCPPPPPPHTHTHTFPPLSSFHALQQESYDVGNISSYVYAYYLASMSTFFY